jgi:hypothetical protein
MAYMDGHQKSGGRVQGVPNKLTKEIRTTLKTLVSKELDALPTYMEKLSEKDRAFLLVKLLPFILPRIEQVHYKEGERLIGDWD